MGEFNPYEAAWMKLKYHLKSAAGSLPDGHPHRAAAFSVLFTMDTLLDEEIARDGE